MFCIEYTEGITEEFTEALLGDSDPPPQHPRRELRQVLRDRHTLAVSSTCLRRICTVRSSFATGQPAGYGRSLWRSHDDGDSEFIAVFFRFLSRRRLDRSPRRQEGEEMIE
ncbi:hypothetical protein GWI33_006110 [Rhynchophorus ferrugineus]|uniref:Uncharacterized protein n=1 Tax=Rhynchophorus ferrugineus TaxID=354439 RepID=A0A834MJ71_RHYFE|nr:hypothetical protein GWI33_006110 [Rhynchophorus ferrugineus]